MASVTPRIRRRRSAPAGLSPISRIPADVSDLEAKPFGARFVDQIAVRSLRSSTRRRHRDRYPPLITATVLAASTLDSLDVETSMYRRSRTLAKV
jgi:hypothetical protein